MFQSFFRCGGYSCIVGRTSQLMVRWLSARHHSGSRPTLDVRCANYLIAFVAVMSFIHSRVFAKLQRSKDAGITVNFVSCLYLQPTCGSLPGSDHFSSTSFSQPAKQRAYCAANECSFSLSLWCKVTCCTQLLLLLVAGSTTVQV